LLLQNLITVFKDIFFCSNFLSFCIDSNSLLGYSDLYYLKLFLNASGSSLLLDSPQNNFVFLYPTPALNSLDLINSILVNLIDLQYEAPLTLITLTKNLTSKTNSFIFTWRSTLNSLLYPLQIVINSDF